MIAIPIASLSSSSTQRFGSVSTSAMPAPPLVSTGKSVRRASPAVGSYSRYAIKNPVLVATIAGALARVPEMASGSAKGPAPRRSSEQFAPTLGSLLSLAGMHSAFWQTAPLEQAPVGGSFTCKVSVTALELETSTTAHPTPMTPQSSAFAAAANAYVPRGKSPRPGGFVSLAANAMCAAAPAVGMPPANWDDGGQTEPENAPIS